MRAALGTCIIYILVIRPSVLLLLLTIGTIFSSAKLPLQLGSEQMYRGVMRLSEAGRLHPECYEQLKLLLPASTRFNLTVRLPVHVSFFCLPTSPIP